MQQGHFDAFPKVADNFDFTRDTYLNDDIPEMLVKMPVLKKERYADVFHISSFTVYSFIRSSQIFHFRFRNCKKFNLIFFSFFS